jgi:Domain of unknown function (DUF5666)
MKQTLRLGAVLAATAAAVGAAPALAHAQPATAAARHFDGTVASVARTTRTFKMRTENGRRIRLVVRRATRFERIAGFSGLAKGQDIEVSAVRRDGRWIALEVERRRDDDRRGDDDERGGDDDRGGDDGRGGDDDGPGHD